MHNKVSSTNINVSKRSNTGMCSIQDGSRVSIFLFFVFFFLWYQFEAGEHYLQRGTGTLVSTLFLHVFLSSDKTPLDRMIRGFQCAFIFYFFFTNATSRKAKFSIFAALWGLPSLLCLLSDSFYLPFFQRISYSNYRKK